MTSPLLRNPVFLIFLQPTIHGEASPPLWLVMLDPVFGSSGSSTLLVGMDFSSLSPLSHVTAKMEQRNGIESSFWHHGIYCGTGTTVLERVSKFNIDISGFHVNSKTLAEYLHAHKSVELICEYDGPQANGSTAETSSTSKGRVTLNPATTWKQIYCTVHVVDHHTRRRPEEEIWRNVIASLGREGYSVLFSNCEHHTTGCIRGKEESRQVRAGVFATVLLTLTAAAGAVAFYAMSGREEEERRKREEEMRLQKLKKMEEEEKEKQKGEHHEGEENGYHEPASSENSI